MASHKDKVAAAIVDAKADLDHALAELERVPALDPSTVGFAAHALNNYLTVIDGTLELLTLNLQGHEDQQVHTWLQSLRQATALMQHTTSQLMSVAVTSGPKLTFGKLDVVTGLERWCAYYQRIADRKQIRIHLEAPPDVPPVWTDRVALGAIVENLLSNAVKFSEPGKRIWVRLKPKENHVLCSVQDEGPGLSPEDQSKLFQRGVRLSTVPTGGEVSTGFGLSVAKELADQLGIGLCCTSQLGAGCCFSFRLPIYRESEHKGADQWRPD